MTDEKRTILIADDEIHLREALASFLEIRGFNVKQASNGSEALKVIQNEGPIDIVISDVRMPNGDGIELLERTKQNHLTAPILIMMTGFSELSLDEAYNKGAEAMFSKPIDSKSLLASIRHLLSTTEERWSKPVDHVSVELPVLLQFPELSQATKARVISLGRGGMFVALTAQQFPTVNDNVHFIIKAKDNTIILEGSGIVRWARLKGTDHFQAGCGIEFTFLSDAHREKILETIRSNNPRAYIPNQ